MKQYLERLKKTTKELRNVRCKIEFIENEYVNIKSPGLKEPGGGYHGNISVLGLKIDKYDKELQDARNEELRLEKQATEQYDETDSMINQLEDEDEKIVLYQKYIMMKTWKEIIDYMPYEQSSVFRLHKNALKKLKKLKSDSE